MADDNPIKLCECGCGNPAPIAKQTCARLGHIQGQSVRFISGHHARTHGHGTRKSRTYHSWQAMLKRCEYTKHIYFKNYGGRGITICERWHTFENFLADMGERPAGMTLDRFPDNDGNYEPGNCRWATTTEQGRNKRFPKINKRMILVTAFGETKPMCRWARDIRCSVSYPTLRYRLRHNWNPEKAITTPV